LLGVTMPAESLAALIAELQTVKREHEGHQRTMRRLQIATSAAAGASMLLSLLDALHVR